MQKTRLSTEAVFLLMKNAFNDLGFKKIEWRCNSLNIPSKSAAIRFGFNFEKEIYGQETPKGVRNTLIFYILKEEWKKNIEPTFCKWLDLANFTKDGMQKLSLKEIRLKNF